jgi:DNA polymerase III subunit alpha
MRIVAKMFCNLHRHDTFSLYDGFGTPEQAARYAKSLGQTALGITNHGNVSGLVEHKKACEEAGIKPVYGVEAYFQPKFNPEKGRYHLTIICQSDEGYHNLSEMMSVAAREQYYRYPILDFKLLRRYSAGLFVFSGCQLGYIPVLLLRNKMAEARRARDKFTDIFGRNFFLELQPINASAQHAVNEGLIHIGGAPFVMTTDAHYTQPEDYPTYQIMWQLGKKPKKGADRPVMRADYSDRHIMTGDEVFRLWNEMHPDPGKKLYVPIAKQAIINTKKIADACNVSLQFKELIPHIDWGMEPKDKLAKVVKNFLAGYTKGMPSKKWARYQAQADKELKVIYDKGFEDYFLLCYFLVEYAKENGIPTGFGRGSVCGSLVAFALGLTRVDPIKLGTYFERFLRPDKNVTPDIDMDFGSAGRGELVNLILQKFAGRATPISNFGYYRAKNLWNDLAKLFEVDKEDADAGKDILERFTTGSQQGEIVKIYLEDLLAVSVLRDLDKRYAGIVHHFYRLYGQVKYFGKHAAGIAISAENIERYAPSMRIKGELQTAYDMDSLSKIGVIKIDVLGLATASIVAACEKATGVTFSYDILKDAAIYKAFAETQTEAIFQFEKEGAKKVLSAVEPQTFNELIACNALNRPGPIELGVLDKYVEGKLGEVDIDSQPWSEFTRETYGQIVYQEQVMQICREIAGMEWGDTDKVMKSVNAKAVDTKLQTAFVEGAMKKSGMSRSVARKLYRDMTLYLFNKGHGAGYTLIAFYQMYFKLYHPLEFWWATLLYEQDDYKQKVYSAAAIRQGIVIMPPHVNGTANYSIETIEGEKCIRAGLCSLKGVGEKAALAICSKGPYKNADQMRDALTKRECNKKVWETLERSGALEFNMKRHYADAVKLNGYLYSADLSVR